MTFADMLTVEDAVWHTTYAINVRAPMRIMRAVLGGLHHEYGLSKEAA